MRGARSPKVDQVGLRSDRAKNGMRRYVHLLGDAFQKQLSQELSLKSAPQQQRTS